MGGRGIDKGGRFRTVERGNEEERGAVEDWSNAVTREVCRMKTLSVPSLAVVLLLSGCSSSEPTIAVQVPSEATNASRLTITKLAIFEDSLAYNNRRVVYLVVDNRTGTEFIGISGIGISEVGTHTVQIGDVPVDVQDER